MKYLPSILASLIISLGVGALVAHAQGYTPLAPLPGTFTEAGETKITNLSTYLSGMLKLLIAAGGALAILMAIIAGTKYVAAGISPDAKSTAKSDLTNAFIGLALILSSYLILNSINPKLVKFNLSLPLVTIVPSVPPTSTLTAWGVDGPLRTQLLNAGVGVNKSSCVNIGDTNCTSIYNLGSSAVTGLTSLAAVCAGCTVIITGGTEYWLHSTNTQHRPGNSVVDLSSSNATLNGKIKNGISLGIQSSCSGYGPAWRFAGDIYVLEPATSKQPEHWHVCYY